MTRACSHNECFSVGKSKASVRALQGDALVRSSTHALCLNRSPFGSAAATVLRLPLMSSGLSREVVIVLDPIYMRRKFLPLVHKSSARESELGTRSIVEACVLGDTRPSDSAISSVPLCRCPRVTAAPAALQPLDCSGDSRGIRRTQPPIIRREIGTGTDLDVPCPQRQGIGHCLTRERWLCMFFTQRRRRRVPRPG